MKTLGRAGVLSPLAPSPRVLSGAIVFFGVLNLPGKNADSGNRTFSVKDSGNFVFLLVGAGEGGSCHIGRQKHDSLGA